MMKEMSIVVEDTPVIKYMPQGKVNGRYMTLRARQIEQMDELRMKARLMNIVLVFGSVFMTASILVGVLYLVG